MLTDFSNPSVSWNLRRSIDYAAFKNRERLRNRRALRWSPYNDKPDTWPDLRGSALLHSAILTALAAPAALMAQDEVQGLEEVTVTAQKREQSALEVPITVNVFSAAEIEKTGALNLSEIQDFIPGFEVGESATQSSLRFAAFPAPTSVPVATPRWRLSTMTFTFPRAATSIAFSDMARIEVLKGPQGTLYGPQCVGRRGQHGSEPAGRRNRRLRACAVG